MRTRPSLNTLSSDPTRLHLPSESLALVLSTRAARTNGKQKYDKGIWTEQWLGFSLSGRRWPTQIAFSEDGIVYSPLHVNFPAESRRG